MSASSPQRSHNAATTKQLTHAREMRILERVIHAHKQATSGRATSLEEARRIRSQLQATE